MRRRLWWPVAALVVAIFGTAAMSPAEMAFPDAGGYGYNVPPSFGWPALVAPTLIT